MNNEKISLKIKKVDLETALNFSNKSNLTTFFTNPNTIRNFKFKIDWWIVYKGEEPLCLWPINKDNDKIVKLPLFFYYFGPIWSNNFIQLSDHSILSKRNKVIDVFVQKFLKEYKNLICQFHYTDHDMRYFLWWNKDNYKKFEIIPKYTSIIENINEKNEKEIISGFRELRKRMLKKAQKNDDIYFEDSFSYEEIFHLYKNTIEKKKQTFEKTVPDLINFFHKLCNKGTCKTIGYREKKNQKLISVILLAFEKNTANVILNLSSDQWKESGITALNMLSAIKYSKENKIVNFDFNGANSPIGADDKQSYGGKSKLYFEIKLNKN